MPHSVAVPQGSKRRFPTENVRRASILTFNVADYGHTLMNDFLIAGGRSCGANSTRPQNSRS